ncbi:uncharacterized protein LOC127462734 [Manacus candei]|uniref:uncharacterized protein LOC127462734 n=1 Tax=Manacus candei TaxID=415023 RepID=UPI0022275FC6|nr:uncharacterized protein LOC127462734 [Manacus candei]
MAEKREQQLFPPGKKVWKLWLQVKFLGSVGTSWAGRPFCGGTFCLAGIFSWSKFSRRWDRPLQRWAEKREQQLFPPGKKVWKLWLQVKFLGSVGTSWAGRPFCGGTFCLAGIFSWSKFSRRWDRPLQRWAEKREQQLFPPGKKVWKLWLQVQFVGQSGHFLGRKCFLWWHLLSGRNLHLELSFQEVGPVIAAQGRKKGTAALSTRKKSLEALASGVVFAAWAILRQEDFSVVAPFVWQESSAGVNFPGGGTGHCSAGLKKGNSSSFHQEKKSGSFGFRCSFWLGSLGTSWAARVFCGGTFCLAGIFIYIKFARMSDGRLQGLTFSGADLSHLDLCCINFKVANLSHCNLARASLCCASLERADLLS